MGRINEHYINRTYKNIKAHGGEFSSDAILFKIKVLDYLEENTIHSYRLSTMPLHRTRIYFNMIGKSYIKTAIVLASSPSACSTTVSVC